MCKLHRGKAAVITNIDWGHQQKCHPMICASMRVVAVSNGVDVAQMQAELISSKKLTIRLSRAASEAAMDAGSSEAAPAEQVKEQGCVVQLFAAFLCVEGEHRVQDVQGTAGT